MKERYSFPDLFVRPVDVDKEKTVVLDRIVIPKIQRPYAQGRVDGVSTFVRNSFLEEIFSYLSSGDIMDLNFVYGIIRSDDKENTMELLDGQQRLTTLFLVYWYIANRELEEGCDEDKRIRECLRKFSYETRSTSTYFCKKLSDFHVDLDEQSPKAAITKSKWYFKSFDMDSTICAMLTMLDAIHKKYTEEVCHDFAKNLDNLRFYVKSLGYYHLSEELYIKMNARGLQLSAFENFKADLTNFISKSDYKDFKEYVSLYREGATEKLPFYQNFSIKLDAKWVDLFWKRGSEDFDSSYMSFFSRYFAYKYILVSADSVTDYDMRFDEGIRELYTDAEPRIQRNEYFGFKPFQNILDSHPEFICSLDKVLDVLYEYDFKEDRKILRKEFIPLWDRDGNEITDDFMYNSRARFTHNKLILLAAVMEFIEAYEKFVPEVYSEWMRVVSNIIENTNIDSLTPVSSLVRKFSKLIKFVVTQDPNPSVTSFYSSLGKFVLEENESRAVEEEVKKARRIAEDLQWLSLFKETECHPFFKGMVLFFYRDDMTIEQFKKGYEKISTMFDKDGITTPYRVNHLLLRAIVSRLGTWGELNQQYVTERSEVNKYLKNILSARAGVRSMFADLALLDGEQDLKGALRDVIANATPVTPWKDITPVDVVRFEYAVDNLRNNVPLYDYFLGKERDKHFFRIYWFQGHIMIAISSSTYERIALDTNRANVALALNKNHGFTFSDENQKNVTTQYGVCFGKEIWMSRMIGDVSFTVGFCTEHAVKLHVVLPTVEAASAFSEAFEGSYISDEQPCTVILPTMQDFPNDSLLEDILNAYSAAETFLAQGSIQQS